MSDWFRVRFKCRDDDCRPDEFPPNGPYWCSGYDGNDKAIVVAYVLDLDEPKKFWKGSTDLDVMEENTSITFTDRFAEPEWWADLAH